MWAYPRFRIESRLFFSCVGLFLALALSSKLVAQSSGSPEYRAMEAHQHGQAELRILLEANLVEMELESPAFNLVGFEQKASSPQEKKAVKNAVALLESPTRLIAFGGSACSPEATQIDVSSVSNEEDEHGHEDANDHEAEHQHEDEHDHEAEHQNEGEHDHEAEHQHEDEHEEERDGGHVAHPRQRVEHRVHHLARVGVRVVTLGSGLGLESGLGLGSGLG